ncbi:MAG: hypothetical protein KAY37_04725 [Phycisphaerae bacterium]|nr:hypothetical protein [Phycisphaerae bacterium]
MTAEQARKWLEDNVPDAKELFALLDRGYELPREVPIGEYPVNPRNAEQEARIVARLIKERILNNAGIHRQ